MNKLNSKTTRIVSALALSAGLFSVSNSAMAVSCYIDTARVWNVCETAYTALVEGKHKMTATAKATDKITGKGVKGQFIVYYNNYLTAANRFFVGSNNVTLVAVGNRKYKAFVYKDKDDGRVTKLMGSVTAKLTP